MSDDFADDAAPWEGIEENFIAKIKTNDNPTKVDLPDHLDDQNWTVWRERLIIAGRTTTLPINVNSWEN